MELHISVNNKIATYQKRDGDIVCGNSDYTIRFLFDEEWVSVADKTARFIWNGTYADSPIVNGVCEVPIIKDATSVEVGVFGGELHTTTSAVIGCKKSILCTDPALNPGQYEVYKDACEQAAERAEECSFARNKIDCEGKPYTLMVESNRLYDISNCSILTIETPANEDVTAHLIVSFANSGEVGLVFPTDLLVYGTDPYLAANGELWEVSIDSVGGILCWGRQVND